MMYAVEMGSDALICITGSKQYWLSHSKCNREIKTDIQAGSFVKP
jgi:hypothetical protein